MTEYLLVKNWDEYQHYKQRNPPWIKLHIKLLNDRKFTALSCASRGLLMQLWVLASEDDGRILNDIEEIKFRLRDKHIKQTDINLLINKGFLNGCKQVLADASKCSSETETEKRQNIGQFEKFWSAYPKKIGKAKCLSIWKSKNPPLDVVLQTLALYKKSRQWQDSQFIPHPSTWLNQKRWEDEVEFVSRDNGGPVVRDTMDPETKRLIREFTKET
jgi:hypothetical protein